MIYTATLNFASSSDPSQNENSGIFYTSIFLHETFQAMPVWEVPRGFDPDEILNQENMEFTKFVRHHVSQMDVVRELVMKPRPLCEDCGKAIDLEDIKEYEGKDWHFVCLRRFHDAIDYKIDDLKSKR